METLGVQTDLITKISNASNILQFYDYAYDSVTLIRCLCHKTRNLWTQQQKAIVNMLQKQTIHLANRKIDERTINVLKKNDKYKLFKLDIEISIKDQARLRLFYRLIEEMPDFEVCRIAINKSSNDLINTLAKKLMYENKQDLYKILEVNASNYIEQSEPLEYLSWLYNPEKHDMTSFVKHIGSLNISKIEKDLNIDCVVNQVEINKSCIQKIKMFNLGTQKFFDSVHIICINNVHSGLYSSLDKDLKLLHKYFKNVKSINLDDVELSSFVEIPDILENCKISQISSEEIDYCDFNECVIESKDGCLVFDECEDQYYFKFKSIKLTFDPKFCKTLGLYVVFDVETSCLKLDIISVAETCQDYDSLYLGAIDTPAIILHRKYIHTLMISENLQCKLNLKPTQSLKLKFVLELGSKELIEYLNVNSLDGLQTEVEFSLYTDCIDFDYCPLSEFENLTEAIFSNCNVKKLTINDIYHHMITSEFHEKISNCRSLRLVKFKNLMDPYSQMLAVKSNPNVKHWAIDFVPDSITDLMKNKLNDLLSNLNDNSLYVCNEDGKLDEVDKITQLFNVSPISYC